MAQLNDVNGHHITEKYAMHLDETEVCSKYVNRFVCWAFWGILENILYSNKTMP